MILIQALPSVAKEALSGKSRDTLPLTWEGRRWTRRRTVTTRGREIGLALPTGTVLPVGGLLWVDSDWYLEVEGAPEPVLAISPRDKAEAVRIAFEVGNRHFSIALCDDTLLVPDDTAMAQLLDRLGATWERRDEVYTPMGFGHGHTHGRDEPRADAAGEVYVHDHGDGQPHAHVRAHAPGGREAHGHDHGHEPGHTHG